MGSVRETDPRILTEETLRKRYVPNASKFVAWAGFVRHVVVRWRESVESKSRPERRLNIDLIVYDSFALAAAVLVN